MTSSYGWAVFETMLALVGVCALAVVCLRWMARRGIGVAAHGTDMSVLDRLPLDARRSLLVVRVHARTFLLGLAESGAPTLLAELEDGAHAAEPSDFRAYLDGRAPGMKQKTADRRATDGAEESDRRRDDALSA